MLNNSTYLVINANVKDFKAFLKKLSYAMSTDDARPYLCGVCFEGKGGEITATATDGSQLASINLAELGSFKYEHSEKDFFAIIPSEAVYAMLSLPHTGNATIHIIIGLDVVSFTHSGGMNANFKIVDYAYPDWRKFTHKTTNRLVSLDAKLLGNLLNAVGGGFLHLHQDADEELSGFRPVIAYDETGGTYLLCEKRVTAQAKIDAKYNQIGE